MTTNDILMEVGRMDKDDLNLVVKAISARREYLNSMKLLEFKEGMTVKWKKGTRTYTGYIMKINSKNVKVKEESGRNWTVHPSYLTIVEGD